MSQCPDIELCPSQASDDCRLMKFLEEGKPVDWKHIDLYEKIQIWSSQSKRSSILGFQATTAVYGIQTFQHLKTIFHKNAILSLLQFDLWRLESKSDSRQKDNIGGNKVVVG
jgi:hypothetical protein